MSRHRCGACNGTGDCHDECHSFLNRVISDSVETVSGTLDYCRACGSEWGRPGKCSVCGGSGEQDD